MLPQQDTLAPPPHPFGTCRREDEVECPYYVVDADGVRVGCHFDKLAPPNQTDYFFLVNGTSEQTAVQFVDFKPFQAMRMGEMISRGALSRDGPGASLGLALHRDCAGLAHRGRGTTKH